jgi:hypothetical protein
MHSAGTVVNTMAMQGSGYEDGSSCDEWRAIVIQLVTQRWLIDGRASTVIARLR